MKSYEILLKSFEMVRRTMQAWRAPVESDHRNTKSSNDIAWMAPNADASLDEQATLENQPWKVRLVQVSLESHTSAKAP
mgnify:CR=1 FL=1